MSLHLKPIRQQVLFITGATSSLGQALVRTAVLQGAHVFMTGRDEGKLQMIQDEMRRKEFPTAFAVSDDEVEQLQIATDHCLRTFGTIDTWINCEDEYWSMVNGCKVAVEILNNSGGSIVNVGKEMQSYTESLRKELLTDRAPIAVSLVIPSIEIGLVAQAILKCAEKPATEVIVRRSHRFSGLKRLLKQTKIMILRRMHGT